MAGTNQRERRRGEQVMKPLRAALIGLNGIGRGFLDAIESDHQFDLMAVADHDSRRIRDTPLRQNIQTFTDHRSLVVAGGGCPFDVLFVAAPAFRSQEFLPLAAERGRPVFHHAPCVRTVDDARRLIALFDANDIPIVVSRPWRFEPAFTHLRRVVERIGGVHLAVADVRSTCAAVGWRGDAARSGGGVLLNDAYDAVDILVQTLGLPDQVYARCATRSAPGATLNYDTEDVAVLTLILEGANVATLSALRGERESVRSITFSGPESSMTLTPNRLTIVSGDGSSVQHVPVRSANTVGPAISAFGAAIRAGRRRPASTLAEHLPTLAVIEAAYLSARTGVPESPQRILD